MGLADMLFAHLAEVVAVDGQDNGIRQQAWTPELGPDQHLPLATLQPSPQNHRPIYQKKRAHHISKTSPDYAPGPSFSNSQNYVYP